ncbi:MAG: hypothetical protein AB8G11_04650 [Saprospiraceae bacterium]
MEKTNKYIRLFIHQIRLQFMCMDISCILVRVGWIFFFLAACYHFTYAQTDSRTLFNQSVDYVNCEFAKQSIKEFNNDIYEQYVAAFPNCGGLEDDFAPKLYTFLTENDMGGTKKLASAINSFKKEYNNEFSPGDEIDEEDIYNVLDSKLFSIDKIRDFKQNHAHSFPTLRRNILNQLQMNLVPDLMIENGQDDAIVIPEITENDYAEPDEDSDYDYEERLEDNNPNRFSTRDYSESGIISRRDILWLFSLLMFGLLAFYFIRSLMPRYTVNQDLQSVQIDDDATKDLLEKLSKRIEDLKEEHHDLKEEFNQLHFRYDSLDRTTDFEKNATDIITEQVEHSIEENAAIEPEIEEIEEQLAPILQEFYFPIPSQEGSFSVNQISEEFRRTHTVYKFRLLDDTATQAEFEIIDDVATMLRALDDPETYLKPVCRSNAIIPISATKIITDEKGLAIYNNNEWQVVRKALIHYV